jgi:hypothetical protein
MKLIASFEVFETETPAGYASRKFSLKKSFDADAA